MAHTMKIRIMFMPAKYLTWQVTRIRNQAQGMLRRISDIPTTAKKLDPVTAQI